MKRFIQGESRSQSTLFPEALDDYISEENQIRVVDVFVDSLDLSSLGFDGVIPHHTGRPSYHPCIMLKLYIYGYLNRIQSSRRLERETQRNVELMWLTERLTPDFKTIADFRRNNGKGIQNVCRQFIELCRKLNFFTDAVVAIDGSKFKAVNNRDNNFTRRKMEIRLERTKECINRYLRDLDKADKKESTYPVTKQNLVEKIGKLKLQMQKLQAIEKKRENAQDKQVSLTDPDSRSMATHGRGSGMVGYNVQSAVDTKHDLIVAHEVTNVGNDRAQLSNMATLAHTAIKTETLVAIADRGYYSGNEILAVKEAGLTPLVPKTFTSGNRKKGLFTKQDFYYVEDENIYRCPQGEKLIYRYTTFEKEKNIYLYWSSNCKECPIKSQCTSGKNRRIRRWEHEQVLDEMEKELVNYPDAMLTRKSTVEHPFGTIKSWMGASHFKMKKLKHVSTEMSLHVLAYNLKRAINILGERALITAVMS